MKKKKKNRKQKRLVCSDNAFNKTRKKSFSLKTIIMLDK